MNIKGIVQSRTVTSPMSPSPYYIKKNLLRRLLVTTLQSRYLSTFDVFNRSTKCCLWRDFKPMRNRHLKPIAKLLRFDNPKIDGLTAISVSRSPVDPVSLTFNLWSCNLEPVPRCISATNRITILTLLNEILPLELPPETTISSIT